MKKTVAENRTDRQKQLALPAAPSKPVSDEAWHVFYALYEQIHDGTKAGRALG